MLTKSLAIKGYDPVAYFTEGKTGARKVSQFLQLNIWGDFKLF